VDETHISTKTGRELGRSPVLLGGRENRDLVVLTPAGERMMQTAEAIESAWLLSKASTGTGEQQLEGVVRTGAPDGFGSIFLMPKLHERSQA
jgi:DNA-binding transcriptional LysR family regulator